MNSIAIFLFEWKHFIRNPFKVIAILLFIAAGIYGLHNGAKLHKKQTDEITMIKQKIREQQDALLTHYDGKESGSAPEFRGDLSMPFWAIWHMPTYHFKNPSPAMVYSIGQAEQYGFYKRISVWASPYDADMAEEIANPERLQSATLDFSFVFLFLAPLLLLVLLHNLQSVESEQGLLPLIKTQTPNKNTWLTLRVTFYVALLLIISIALIFYGAVLTNVLETSREVVVIMVFYALLYLVFWSVIYFFVLLNCKSIVSSSLKMIGIWLIFIFIIPGAVHQWVSISHPANLMTDLIDLRQDGQEKLFSQPDDVKDAQLIALYPQISNSPVAKNSTKIQMVRMFSTSGLANQMMKEATGPIVKENGAKNTLIQQSYLFSPVTFFQNKFNSISKTHYNDYEDFRNGIQHLVEKRIERVVVDSWGEVVVDKDKYEAYYQLLNTVK